MEVIENTGWWFQPIWKIGSSNWKSSPNRGENKTYLSCHHLETSPIFSNTKKNVYQFAHIFQVPPSFAHEPPRSWTAKDPENWCLEDNPSFFGEAKNPIFRGKRGAVFFGDSCFFDFSPLLSFKLTPSNKVPRWWLNQPLWEICNRQIGFHFPRDRGENSKNVWVATT